MTRNPLQLLRNGEVLGTYPTRTRFVTFGAFPIEILFCAAFRPQTTYIQETAERVSETG
jgi:hypothetical protein